MAAAGVQLGPGEAARPEGEAGQGAQAAADAAVPEEADPAAEVGRGLRLATTAEAPQDRGHRQEGGRQVQRGGDVLGSVRAGRQARAAHAEARPR